MGELYIDRGNRLEYVCDTLEDKWRDLLNGEKKIYGATCIEEGIFTIDMKSLSPKYVNKIMANPCHALAFTKGYIPRIVGTKFHSGCLLHTGNTHLDTDGCPILGTNNGDGTLRGGSSVPAFTRLYPILKHASDTAEEIKLIVVKTW